MEPDPVYARVRREGCLRVAAVNVPPQSFSSPTAPHWRGFDADLLRQFAELLDVKLELVWSTVTEVVEHVSNNRAEMGTGLFWTGERAAKIRFTIPYKWVGDHVVTRASDRHLRSLASFRDRELGVASGTSEEAAAIQLQREGHIRAIRTFATLNEAYRALESGIIDGIINKTQYHLYRARTGATLGTQLAFEVEPRFFGRNGLNSSHLVVTPRAPMLGALADEFIGNARASGQLARIFRSYGLDDAAFWTPPTS